MVEKENLLPGAMLSPFLWETAQHNWIIVGRALKFQSNNLCPHDQIWAYVTLQNVTVWSDPTDSEGPEWTCRCTEWFVGICDNAVFLWLFICAVMWENIPSNVYPAKILFSLCIWLYTQSDRHLHCPHEETLHHVPSEDSDQTNQIGRPIWIFAGRTCPKVCFLMWLILFTECHRD